MKFANNIVVIDVVGNKSISYSGNYACPEHNIGFEELTPRLFSFNSPYGACEQCSGIGYLLRISEDLVIPDREKTLYDGIKAFGSSELKRSDTMARMYFESIGKHYGVNILNKKIKDLPKDFMDKILYGTGDEEIDFIYESETGIRRFTRPFEGVIPILERRHRETKSEGMRRFYELYMHEMPCRKCNGTRLKAEVLYVLVGDLNIHELTSMSIDKIRKYLNELELDETEMLIAEAILKETNKRLEFLENVGLSYLTLSRAAGTLSGGEAQRIRLATQIGSGLTGVIYILDEPSIGLHQRDNNKLLATLKNLRDLGNTVIVVEHDEDTMRAADQIIDIGPEAGINGGRIIAQGSVNDIIKVKQSITGKYLSGELSIPLPKKRRKGSGKYIDIIGAKENNLKNIDVKIPLGKLILVTGVSGSGKSSLIYETLYLNVKNKLNKTYDKAGEVDEIKGLNNIDKIISIDQSPIGRTPRSNPATYTGVMDEIRDVFATTNEAKMRGYKKGRFSFNVKGGRCEVCEGDGLIKIEMHFLPDVYVPCEVCNGKRYNKETLEVRFKGKNIADVLDMNAYEAIDLFQNLPKIKNKLQLLIDVGLGYLKLGQNSTTLSGGEAQRIKISKELSKRSTGKTLYVLDEPTTGLHTHDIAKLIEILNRLVDSGNTVIVIEHNMDLIKTADHIIDLGPEGGDAGGRIIIEGTPEEIVRSKQSYTGQSLKKSKYML